MLTKILSFVGGLFSSDKASDTVLDGVRKIAGLDNLNEKDKSAYILQYLESTKHQSPTRRFIALLMVLGFMVFTGTWLLTTIAMWMYLFFGGDPELAKNLDMLRDDIFLTCKEILLQPVNLIVTFYFVVDVAKKFGNK